MKQPPADKFTVKEIADFLTVIDTDNDNVVIFIPKDSYDTQAEALSVAVRYADMYNSGNYPTEAVAVVSVMNDKGEWERLPSIEERIAFTATPPPPFTPPAF
jgi:hypothetical protein